MAGYLKIFQSHTNYWMAGMILKFVTATKIGKIVKA